MKTNLIKQLSIFLFALFSLNACDFLDGSEYPVVDSGVIVGNESAYWLDNTHMLVRPGNKYGIDKHGKEVVEYFPLQIWDVSMNQFSLLPEQNATAGDSYSTPCVSNGIIRYTRETKLGEGSYGDSEFLVISYKSVDGKLEFGKEKPDTARGDFDKVNCLYRDETVLPDWVKQVPKRDIIMLKPEHGFLFLDKENYMAVPKGLYLYPPNSTGREGAQDLFKLMHITPVPHETYGYNVGSSNVTYCAFKNAYKVDLRGSDITWWLYPDGHVENGGDWGEFMPIRNRDNEVIDKKYTYLDWYIPTAVYPVAANYSRFIKDTIDDFGLYAYMGDRNNPKRLVKGRVGSNLQVSPDGCKVAFTNDDRPHINGKEDYKLQVIDLCTKGEQ